MSEHINARMNLLPKGIFILYDDTDIYKIYWNRSQAEEERQRLIQESLDKPYWKVNEELSRHYFERIYFVRECDVEEP